MKHFLLSIIAIQLLPTDKVFLERDVINYKDVYQPGDPFSFAIIEINGAATKIEQGQWLVEYPDGTKEVWNDSKIQADAVEVIGQAITPAIAAEEVTVINNTPVDLPIV